MAKPGIWRGGDEGIAVLWREECGLAGYAGLRNPATLPAVLSACDPKAVERDRQTRCPGGGFHSPQQALILRDEPGRSPGTDPG